MNMNKEIPIFFELNRLISREKQLDKITS